MSTPFPPDQREDESRAASPSGPVRFPTGQPNFPYPGPSSPTQPGLGQPYAPSSPSWPYVPPSQPAYSPPPAGSYTELPPVSYAPPPQPYAQEQLAQPYPPAQTVPPYPQAQPVQAHYYVTQVVLPPNAAPPHAQPSYGGLILALLGNIAVIVAFFALPLLSVGPWIGVSGYQIYMLLNAAYSQCTATPASSSSCPSFNISLLLWIPVAAAGLCVLVMVSGLLSSASSGKPVKRGASTDVIVFSIVGILALGYLVLGVFGASGIGTAIVVSVLGIGFWVMVAGFVVGFMGAIVQLASR